MASSSGCDLAHLLTPALLRGGGGRKLPSSGDVILTMGQVPCEFWADWPRFSFLGEAKLRGLGVGQVLCELRADQPNFIFQPVAPDMIWHIYSGQCCFNGVLGIDLLSSWGICPHYGAGPLWVLGRSAKLHFSAGGSWHDLAHLLWAVLLQGGFRYGPAVFKGCCPHHGTGPLWVLGRLAKFHFSVSSSWHDLAHLVQAVLLNRGWCHPLAIFRGGDPWSGEGPLQVSWWVQDPLKMADPYLQSCPQ